jgi:BlaI family transcriptional regulator, penicillinase repressor
MSRSPTEPLTPREAEIMRVLWAENEPLTADQIRQALANNLHDSTVRTQLRVLKNKAYVTFEQHGKAYRYRPTVKRSTAERKALQTMLHRFFGGSPKALLQRLLEDEQLTPEDLEALRREFDGRPARRSQPDP